MACFRVYECEDAEGIGCWGVGVEEGAVVAAGNEVRGVVTAQQFRFHFPLLLWMPCHDEASGSERAKKVGVKSGDERGWIMQG